MNQTITEHSIFKPKSSKAETKADITNNAARAIIDDEALRREKKTAKLRQARLEQEAQLATVEEPVKARPARRAKKTT